MPNPLSSPWQIHADQADQDHNYQISGGYSPLQLPSPESSVNMEASSGALNDWHADDNDQPAQHGSGEDGESHGPIQEDIGHTGEPNGVPANGHRHPPASSPSPPRARRRAAAHGDHSMIDFFLGRRWRAATPAPSRSGRPVLRRTIDVHRLTTGVVNALSSNSSTSTSTSRRRHNGDWQQPSRPPVPLPPPRRATRPRAPSLERRNAFYQQADEIATASGLDATSSDREWLALLAALTDTYIRAGRRARAGMRVDVRGLLAETWEVDEGRSEHGGMEL